METFLCSKGRLANISFAFQIGQAASTGAVTYYENPSINVIQKNDDMKINGHLRVVTVIVSLFSL